MTDAKLSTRYFGVFCVDCHKFIQLGSYPSLHPFEFGSDFDPSADTATRCPHCGESCSYTKADVAHSDALDGREPRYRHRR